MKKQLWRRGVVLLQTLVITVILSMISVMILKWIMGRYMMAARNYRSVTTLARAHGYSHTYFSSWNFRAAATITPSPTITESSPPGFSQLVCVQSCGSTRFAITSNQDDPTDPCPPCP